MNSCHAISFIFMFFRSSCTFECSLVCVFHAMCKAFVALACDERNRAAGPAVSGPGPGPDWPWAETRVT